MNKAIKIRTKALLIARAKINEMSEDSKMKQVIKKK